MALCPWHHTFKVTYTLKGDMNKGPGKRIALVEAANSSMAWQQVQDENGGPLECQVWRADQID